MTGVDTAESEFGTQYRVLEARYDNMPEDELLGAISTAAERTRINTDPVIETRGGDIVVGAGRTSKFGFKCQYE